MRDRVRPKQKSWVVGDGELCKVVNATGSA